jgi:ubiquitin carboxyl-terminal hydrolase 36/42
VNELHAGKGGVVAPTDIVNNLSALSSTFQPGRQEDSHEFLRFVMDHLQKAQLGSHKRIKETNMIFQLFGGYLRRQVKCSVCKHESNHYDPLMDLSLQLGKGVSTLSDALDEYTGVENLCGANQPYCGNPNNPNSG